MLTVRTRLVPFRILRRVTSKLRAVHTSDGSNKNVALPSLTPPGGGRGRCLATSPAPTEWVHDLVSFAQDPG